MIDTFSDVYTFQTVMGLPMPARPQPMDAELTAFRVKFMVEELQEFRDALDQEDFVKAVDALIDLVYVAHGTLAFMGVGPDLHSQLWRLVHTKNMQKRRAASAEESQLLTTRGHTYDVIKPPGWVSPEAEMRQVLTAAGASFWKAER